MELLVDSLEFGMLDVCVDLCGLDTGVTEHLLHHSQVCSAGQ